MAAADGTAAAAAEKMQARAARLRDLSPVMRTQSEAMTLETSDAFRNERSPAGEKWWPLSLRTLEVRAAKLPGAHKRDKRTGKSRFQRAIEEHGAGGKDIKILLDTGHLRNSIRYSPQPHAILVEAVAYVRAHLDGTSKVPKRNPLVIERDSSGVLRLHAKAAARFSDAITRYVETGKA